MPDENAEPWGGIMARSAGGVQLRKDWFVSAAQTDVLSASWLNEARVQVSRARPGGALARSHLRRDLRPDGRGWARRLTLPGVGHAGRAYYTPQPRLHNRIQLTDTVSYFGGNHLLKAGVDFEIRATPRPAPTPRTSAARTSSRPLPGIVLGALGLPPRAAAALRRWRRSAYGLPGGYVQGYGDPETTYAYKEVAAFVQDEWRLTLKAHAEGGRALPAPVWPGQEFDVADVGGTRLQYAFARGPQRLRRRAWPSPSTRAATAAPRCTLGYGLFHADHISGAAGVARIVERRRAASASTRATSRTRSRAWYAPRPPRSGAVGLPRAWLATMDPGLQTPFAHQVALGFDQSIGDDFVLSANLLHVRGHNQLGIIDYNPLVPALGPGRRPNDVNGVPGTSAPLYQYTSYGDSWYKGLALSLTKRFSHGYEFLASYTLSKAEDTVDRLLHVPRRPGRRPQPGRPDRACRWASTPPPSAGRRPTTSATASC